MKLLLTAILSLIIFSGKALEPPTTTDEIYKDPLFNFISSTSQEPFDFKVSAKEDVDNFINKIKSKKNFGNNEYMIRKVFYSIHRKYLKSYNQYSHFDQIFKDGNYDCLTATALYAYIFDAFGFQYKILKTDYHIFLAIKTDEENTLLIEPTDPLAGIISDEILIQDQFKKYLEESHGTIETVHLNEITGLLYFNEAVRIFNNQEYLKAFDILEVGFRYFRDRSMEELLDLVILNISESGSIDTPAKNEYNYRFLKITGQNSVASNIN